MKPCHCCGNTYRNSFQVSIGGVTYEFDSFECAIQTLAPNCEHCGCRVIGHGVEGEDGEIFCCAHCAREAGAEGFVDNAAHG